MAATKFSVITTGDNPSWHIRVKELPGKHTYKIAVTVAKALMQEVEGEEIVTVVGEICECAYRWAWKHLILDWYSVHCRKCSRSRRDVKPRQ